jgi:plastocyanin
MFVRRAAMILAVMAVFVSVGSPAVDAATLIKGVSTSNGPRWKPKSVSIAVGAKVTWKAVSGPHTVTAYKGAWNKNTSLSQGGTTSFTFKKKGVYKYRCLITGHSTLVNGVCSGMCGKITVG